ncbi:hypothetical protein GE09DRAFT_423657 [Coniochaeta sp. 2T2.1]|nr:hypothetical protein GE09DRAFT_423657 [Coniochaeta sp. 2T2.1]
MFKYMLYFIAATALYVRGALVREGVHLVHCSESWDDGKTHGPWRYSAMNYYADDSKAHAGAGGGFPDRATFDPKPAAGKPVTFQDQVVKGKFKSGVVFTSYIKKGVDKLPAFSYAGWGTNGYRNFECWRDDEHLIFWLTPLENCYSIYYCL